MLNELLELQTTTKILLVALVDNDREKANEAISVLLMQGTDWFGPEHPAMQQFFPVWDAIRSHLENGNVEQALNQSQTWDAQLSEVINLVKSAQ